MTRSSRPAKLVLALLLAAGAARAQPVEIVLDAGRYLAIAPVGQAAAANRPATMLLHGAWSGPKAFAEDAAIVAAFAADGVMLLLPEGIDGSWAARGAPRGATRDERAFLDAVRADAISRFALDARRFRVAGFSVGASMAFDFACRAESGVQAVLTVGGVVWQPIPPACDAPAVPWLHIHGSADPTWPLGGRTIRMQWRQGDVGQSIAMLGRSFACAAPRPAPAMSGLACEDFSACRPGAHLRSCRHAGAHDLDAEWFRAFHAWVEGISTAADRR